MQEIPKNIANSFSMGIKANIDRGIIYFLLALLGACGAGVSMHAQTSETVYAIRYGKQVMLTKDPYVRIENFYAVEERNVVTLNWRIRNLSTNGVCAVMRSDNGINYSYIALMIASKGKNEFTCEDNSSNRNVSYQILYISSYNTYSFSERENISAQYANQKY